MVSATRAGLAGEAARPSARPHPIETVEEEDEEDNGDDDDEVVAQEAEAPPAPELPTEEKGIRRSSGAVSSVVLSSTRPAVLRYW